MGWSEMPGDKDPWKSPPRDPEFDLWLKRLRDRWKRPRPPTGRDPWRGLRRNQRLTLLLPLVVFLGFWFSSGLVSVPAGRVGYVFLAGYPAGSIGPGLHWLAPWPFTRVLLASSPTATRQYLRVHATTADGRRVVVELRYRLRDLYPQRTALSRTHPADEARARLRHLLLVFLARFPRRSLTNPATTASLEKALETQWRSVEGKRSTPAPSPQGARIERTKITSTAVSLEVLGLQVDSPRATRKLHDTLSALARHQQTLLAEARDRGRQRLKLARLEATAILARARRSGRNLLARARERIALFQTYLPVYRRDPLLARRLIALAFLRRLMDKVSSVVLVGHGVEPILGIRAAKLKGTEEKHTHAAASSPHPVRSRPPSHERRRRSSQPVA